MTEDFDREVTWYREAILEAMKRVDPRLFWDTEVPELAARFAALSQGREDREHFRQLCLRLLEDEQSEVRLGTMKLLAVCRIQDSSISMALVAIAVKEKSMREEALHALAYVRTRRVLPYLLIFAEKGYESAIFMIRRMLQTPEEIKQGIAIARKYIASKTYGRREGALFLLQKYSTMDEEAEYVLGAVQKYMDELFIDALKKAPPERVLEPLKALRSTFAEKHVQAERYGEYQDLSSTIAALEDKKRQIEEQQKEEENSSSQ
jgi:hypothetical protein